MLSASRDHPWVTGLLVLTLLLTVGFGAHAGYMLVTRWINLASLRVEGWMTPRLVVLNFGLPPDALAPVLGLPEQDTPFITLDDLAAKRGMETQALITGINGVIAAAGVKP